MLPEKNRTLVLSHAEWLALLHELNNHAMDDDDLQHNCPFLYAHLKTIADRMLEETGNKTPNLAEQPVYGEWYKNHEQCDRCKNWMTYDQLNDVDDENVCSECMK